MSGIVYSIGRKGRLILTSLHALVHELTPYECREFRDVLNQETYQKDIVVSLPLELLILVLRHVDVSELFSWQRVCARHGADL